MTRLLASIGLALLKAAVVTAVWLVLDLLIPTPMYPWTPYSMVFFAVAAASFRWPG